MHALIVIAHPEVDSFTVALGRRAAAALTDAGWSVDLNDLTREGFRAEAGRGDVIDPPVGVAIELIQSGRAVEVDEDEKGVADRWNKRMAKPHKGKAVQA